MKKINRKLKMQMQMKINRKAQMKRKVHMNKKAVSTTPKPSTTPECNRDNFCSLIDLNAQLLSKKNTKAKIQYRIDNNEYEKNIKSAQDALDLEKAVKPTNEGKIEELNSIINVLKAGIKQLEAEWKNCIATALDPSSNKSIQDCRKKVDERIQIEKAKITGIKNTIKDLNEEIAKSPRKIEKLKNQLNIAKRQEVNDLNELISCQKTINNLTNRINAIKESCGKKTFNCNI